jgi:FMN phosphatase YigB (HAD superfamily)
MRQVVFDIGQVFVELDYRRLMRLVRERAPGPIDILSVAGQIGLEDHESGRIDGERLLANIAAVTAGGASPQEVRAAWLDMFVLEPRMVELARRLSARYRVHLLSNIGDLHWEHLSRTFGIDRIGHGALPSFHARVMKPHGRIYELAENRFALEPSATVFIDDRAENVAAARARGWHAILHCHHDSTVAALEGLGVDTR